MSRKSTKRPAKRAVKNPDRRSFMRKAGFGMLMAVPFSLAANKLFGGGIPAVAAPKKKSGGAAPANAVKESDPQAQSLGYKMDATKVDTKKWTKRAGPDGKTQFCHNCQFFQGKAGDKFGPCQIFAGKEVAANGWCNTWTKKA
jgi:hypothetical protein